MAPRVHALTPTFAPHSRRRIPAQRLPRPPPVRNEILARGHDLDALLAAPPRAAAARFLERHQKSERGIFELQMPQHVPVLAHVALQVVEDVAEGDDPTRWDRRAGRERAEGDEADDDARR